VTVKEVFECKFFNLIFRMLNKSAFVGKKYYIIKMHSTKIKIRSNLYCNWIVLVTLLKNLNASLPTANLVSRSQSYSWVDNITWLLLRRLWGTVFVVSLELSTNVYLKQTTYSLFLSLLIHNSWSQLTELIIYR